MSFMPPRASRLEKCLHLTSLCYACNRLFGWIPPLLNRVLPFNRIVAPHLTALANIQPLDFFLPGYAFWRSGTKQAGMILLFVWLAGLLLTLFGIGTTLGTAGLGIIAGAHLTSIFRYVITREDLYDHAGSILCFTIPLVFCCLYLPIIVLSVWLLDIRMLGEIHADPIQPRDRIIAVRLFNRDSLAPGDCVLYTLPPITYQLASHQFARIEGPQFNRILAVAGQHVSWEKGILTIDGKPSAATPLGLLPPPPDTQFDVPPGHVVLVPAAQVHGFVCPKTAANFQEVVLVQNDRVHSRVLFLRRNFFHFVPLN